MTGTGDARDARDTRHLLIARGALSEVAACVGAVAGVQGTVVVADERTYELAGRAVDRTLRAAGREVRSPVVFPARPRLHADYRSVEWLRERLTPHGAVPVAVGAGTINDLTKLAAHLAGRPYAVVATAASMDGYAAFGAAITRDGFKQTMACPAPRAIVADVDILAAAPREMTAAGFGDLLGKVTAGADWLLADALGVEPIDPPVWATVQPAVRQALPDAPRLPAGEPAAIERLFRCLVESGLAMQAARSSRPASGAEHQLSHLWEMRGLSSKGEEISHGFKVGIGTIMVSCLYEYLLAQDMSELDVAARCRGWPGLAAWEAEVGRTHPEAAIRRQALAETRAKYVTAEQLGLRLERLKAAWPALRARLRAQLLPPGEVRRLLSAAGCPTEPGQIGLTSEEVRASFGAARQIRRRYTVLDLAAETGHLAPALEALFGQGGAGASR